MKHVLIFLFGIGSATAADCPPDRPIKKIVVDYPGTVTCPLKACLGKLICEPGYDICTRAPAANCNTCTGPTHREQCFTQKEIDEAR